MNGTSKTMMAIVSMIALLYSALCFYLTLKHLYANEPLRFYLFFPINETAGFCVSDILAKYGITDFTVYYDQFINKVMSYLPASVEKYSFWIKFAMVICGFLLAVCGFLTKEAIDCKGKTNPAEYLWTHRPMATLRALALPWDIIVAAWKRFKPLVVIPIILLPFYAPWAIFITIMLIFPFVICKAYISGKIMAASRKERRDFAKNTEYGVCPNCKRDFQRPVVKCRCGLVIEYPVPNRYGYAYHTCNNGHDIPCTAGKRGELRTFCPHCGDKIVTREAKPLAISFVGAVGSGKTTFMLAAVQSITDNAKMRGVSVELPSKALTKNDLNSRDYAPKTVPGELESRCMFLSASDLRGREIVFNDISGEEFKPRADKILFEEYYNYTDGFIFVFDPMTLKKEYLKDSPTDVFTTFHAMYTNITHTNPKSAIDVPLAIVATRRDLTKPTLRDDDVRQYLIDNKQEMFVHLMETVFKDVRYFSVQATGDGYGSAIRPVWWIAEKTDPELVKKIPTQ